MSIKALQFWLPIAKVSLKLKNRITRSIKRILHLLLFQFVEHQNGMTISVRRILHLLLLEHPISL